MPISCSLCYFLFSYHDISMFFALTRNCAEIISAKNLYKASVNLAKENGWYNLMLNVWSCNPSALRFYEACGLVPQKIGMELLL